MSTKTKEQWIEMANETLPKCRWFIVKHFGVANYEDCLLLLSNRHLNALRAKLMHVWYKLPDHLFNIVVMPSGWREFLELLETNWKEEVVYG